MSILETGIPFSGTVTVPGTPVSTGMTGAQGPAGGIFYRAGGYSVVTANGPISIAQNSIAIGGAVGAGHGHAVLGGGGGGGGGLIGGGGGLIGGGSYSFTTGTLNTTVNYSHDLTFHLNGAVPSQGEKFNNGRDLFTVNLRLDDQRQHHFHYETWIALHGETFDNYGIVFRSGDGCYPAWTSAEARDHFEEWYAEYVARFFKDRDPATTSLPEIKQGSIKGFFVEDDTQKLDIVLCVDPCFLGQERLAEWAFIVSHCRDEAVRLKTGWLFSNDADAVMFKMR